MDFLTSMKERAKADKKTIVLPETKDKRTINAASQLLGEGISNVVLVGNEEDIKKNHPGFDLTGATFVDPATYDKLPTLINQLYDMRKYKGMTLEEADRLLRNNNLFLGVMLVKDGTADGMVAGCMTSTANVFRPSLQILKTDPSSKLVSTFFIMIVPNSDLGYNGVFAFADCSLNQDPSSEDLAEIAISTADSFRKFVGGEPIVAMLSHSTYGSAKHAVVDKVSRAVQLAKAARPDILIDGELQLDAAIIDSIGQQKAPGSPIAGKANVLIFPDIDSGNIGYKLVQRLANAHAYGPITQGIGGPVNDLSRGCSAEDIVAVASMTAVQAQKL